MASDDTKPSVTESAKQPKERMLRWFKYGHLPPHLQAVSKPYGELAEHLCATIPPGPERTVALRKLVESKDAAVRASLPDED